jgi:hypothetical protein
VGKTFESYWILCLPAGRTRQKTLVFFPVFLSRKDFSVELMNANDDELTVTESSCKNTPHKRSFLPIQSFTVKRGRFSWRSLN